MSCAKRLCFSSKGSRCQDWSKHDRVLCHSQNIVISEWHLCMLRHVLPRFALNVLCHTRGSSGSSVQPGRIVNPTRRYSDRDDTRNLRPAFHSQLRCPKDVQQVMKAHSVNVASPYLTLHTFPDTSTTAPMPCGTGQYSFQRSSCSSQASVNDLIK